MSQEFADAIQDETIETNARDTDAPPPPDRDIYQEAVEITLTDEDRLTKLQRLAVVDAEVIRLEEEKKAAAKVFTNQIKPLEAEREGILKALADGTEKRMVDCYEDFDERLGNVYVRRVDTDEVVEERAMTAAEREESAERRQGNLFGDDTRDTDAPPPDLHDPADPDNNLDDDQDLEPTPEALALAAEDEGRVVKTTAVEVKTRKRKQRDAAAEELAE